MTDDAQNFRGVLPEAGGGRTLPRVPALESSMAPRKNLNESGIFTQMAQLADWADSMNSPARRIKQMYASGELVNNGDGTATWNMRRWLPVESEGVSE